MARRSIHRPKAACGKADERVGVTVQFIEVTAGQSGRGAEVVARLVCAEHLDAQNVAGRLWLVVPFDNQPLKPIAPVE